MQFSLVWRDKLLLFTQYYQLLCFLLNQFLNCCPITLNVNKPGTNPIQYSPFSPQKVAVQFSTLGDAVLAARCLMLNSYLIDRYFSVRLTTNIGDVKLSTNVVYARNGLCPWFYSNPAVYISRSVLCMTNMTRSKIPKVLVQVQGVFETDLFFQRVNPAVSSFVHR